MREGDHVYFLAPPDRVQALDRFFAERPPQASPDAALVEDFFVPGDVTLGALARNLRPDDPAGGCRHGAGGLFRGVFHQAPAARRTTSIPLGPVKLVAHTVTDDRVVTVGLQLAEPEPVPRTIWDKLRIRGRRDAAPAVRGAACGDSARARSGAAPARRRRTAPRPRTVAGDGVFQERQRQRRSTASARPCRALYMPLNAHTANSWRRRRSASRPARSGTTTREARTRRASMPATAGSSQRRIDHGHHLPVVEADARRRRSAWRRAAPASASAAPAQHHAGEQRRGRDRRDVRHVRQQPRGDVEADQEQRPAAGPARSGAVRIRWSLRRSSCRSSSCEAPV